MAIIYFPKSANLGFRDSFNPTYESLIIASTPNTVLYFDSGSQVNSVSASNLYITASWALTASVAVVLFSSSYASSSTTSTSSSYAATASVALNSVSSTVGNSLSSSIYTTITTSSLNWITASFANVNQYITITSGLLYNFTASDVPSSGTSSNLSLFINNTAIATSSLSFPSNWVFIGIVPTFLTSSKSAFLSLKAFGNQVVAAWGTQY